MAVVSRGVTRGVSTKKSRLPTLPAGGRKSTIKAWSTTDITPEEEEAAEIHIANEHEKKKRDQKTVTAEFIKAIPKGLAYKAYTGDWRNPGVNDRSPAALKKRRSEWYNGLCYLNRTETEDNISWAKDWLDRWVTAIGSEDPTTWSKDVLLAAKDILREAYHIPTAVVQGKDMTHYHARRIAFVIIRRALREAPERVPEIVRVINDEYGGFKVDAVPPTPVEPSVDAAPVAAPVAAEAAVAAPPTEAPAVVATPTAAPVAATRRGKATAPQAAAAAKQPQPSVASVPAAKPRVEIGETVTVSLELSPYQAFVLRKAAAFRSLRSSKDFTVEDVVSSFAFGGFVAALEKEVEESLQIDLQDLAVEAGILEPYRT